MHALGVPHRGTCLRGAHYGGAHYRHLQLLAWVGQGTGGELAEWQTACHEEAGQVWGSLPRNQGCTGLLALGKDRLAYSMRSSLGHLSNITNKAGSGLCPCRVYSPMKRQVQV